MARAKRTHDRAEARRRHRAALVAATSEPETIGDDPGAPDGGRPATGEPVQRRPGIFGAITGAIRPIDLRDDVRTFPAVARTSKAVWLPLLVIAVGTIVGVFPGAWQNEIALLGLNVILFPPPMVPAFLAGMVAPRSAWLAGLLAGLLSGIGFSLVVLLGAIPATIMAADQRMPFVLYALGVSPAFGLGVGAFAGFYRRFLRLTAIDRGARAGGGRSRPNNRRSRARH